MNLKHILIFTDNMSKLKINHWLNESKNLRTTAENAKICKKISLFSIFKNELNKPT